MRKTRCPTAFRPPDSVFLSGRSGTSLAKKPRLENISRPKRKNPCKCNSQGFQFFLDIPAEREGFEPPEPLSSTVFKTAAIDHSAIFPGVKI